jgi:hypothetical protein
VTIPKLDLRVDQEGYSVTFPTALVQAQLDGGRPRTRLDILGQCYKVSVQWTRGPLGYKYLKQIQRYVELGTPSAGGGGAYFTIDLIIEHEFIEEYTATFVPETFNLNNQSGDLYVVQADLWVLPKTGVDASWPSLEEYESALLDEGGGALLL